MASYTRQSTFGDGDLITAALFNNEYNQLVDAFSNTTGHKHDGTVGEGPVIGIIGDAGVVTPLNKILVDSTNDHIEFWIDVSGTSTQQFYIADGAILPVTDNDIDLGSNSLQFKDLYINGTANIDSLVADTADINGGTIDGVTIGASSAGAITGTTITATSFVIGSANITETELEILDGATLTTTELNYVDGVTSSIQTQINTKAPLASPSLTGIPTAPTAASNTNTTQVATTAYVQTEITDLIDAAPGTLDTLNELAAAINDDANYNTTLTTALATKLPLAGGTMTGDVTYSDNVKAQFGTSQDLQIYHDGSNSYIKDAGIGNLQIQATGSTFIKSSDGTKISAQFAPDSYTRLYYNNAIKLQTTSTGIDVTGVITTDGLTTSADINFGDDDKAIFGAGSDLQIYHDGSNSYIKDTGTGTLRIQGSSSILMQKLDGEIMMIAREDGAVELNHNGSQKIKTTSSGIDVTGTVKASTSLMVGSTDAPARDLEIKTTNPHIRLTDTDSSGGYTEIFGGSGITTINADKGQAVAGSALKLSVDATDGLTIDSNHNVDIPNGNLDVTGTVTADGLTSEGTLGTWEIQDGGNIQTFSRAGANYIRASNASGILRFDTGGSTIRQRIGSNGDISFYDDTGSSQSFFWDSSAERLGIGTTSPSRALHVNSSSIDAGIRVESTDANTFIEFKDSTTTTIPQIGGKADDLVFRNNDTESMRITSGGNLLVGKTNTTLGSVGIENRADGRITSTRSGNTNLVLNRLTSDGSLIDFYKNGLVVGSIGVQGGRLTIGSDDTHIFFDSGDTPSIRPHSGTASTNGVIDIGESGTRFKDIYLSGTANFGSLSDGTITITGFVDEDNMATNSATLVPTQQSVKAYVDSQISSAGGNGISFEDNEKAQFGASNDLQIYHDGSHSYIQDSGSGNLRILVGDMQIRNYGTNENIITSTANAEVTLYHNASAKLATTSTGIDVTGTVTSDGLTSSGNLDIVSSYPRINLTDTGENPDYSIINANGVFNIYDVQNNSNRLSISSTGNATFAGTVTSDGFQTDTANTTYNLLARNSSNAAVYLQNGGTGDVLQVRSGNMAAGQGDLHLKVANNGDISFYDDTGSTQGLFWDASAEKLGIGTSSPSEKLTVAGIVKSNGLSTNTAGVSNFIAGVNAGSSIISGGEYNTLIGDEAGASITTGDFNVAVGTFSLDANTTAGENTAIGYASLSNNITGARNVASGFRALQLNTAANDNTATGYFSLYSTTGSNNTAIGKDAGKNITTGSKNTIIGSFDGNEGGLDIRTANNHIVLSDGDGNPRQVIDSSGNATFSGTVTSDGLTVNSDTILLDSGSSAFMKIDRGSNSTFGIARYYTAGVEDWRLGTINDSTSNFYLQDASSIKRFQVATNGDISFYEDTGTTQALFWDSSAERLGIGTTSPSAALHISGTSADQIRLERANHDTFRIGLQSAVGLGFHNVTDNRTDMMIKGDGSVGIGTSSPSSSKLTVQGDIRIRDSIASLFLQDTEGTNQVSEIKQSAGVTTISSRNNTSNGAILFTGYNGSATTEYARFNSSGRLGIGTTSPDYALDIRDDTNIQLKLSSTTTTNNARIAYAINNVQKWSHGVQASDSSFTFYDIVTPSTPFKIEQGAANNTLVVDSNSRVGIGINNPQNTLQVNAPANDGIKISSTTPYLFLNDTDSGAGYDGSISQSGTTTNIGGASAAQTLVFRNKVSFGESARLDTSGNFLVSTTDNSPVGNNVAGGIALLSNGSGQFSRDGGVALLINRKTSDGELLRFNKDGAEVGSIKSRSGDLIIHTGITGLRFNDGNDAIHPVIVSGSVSDGATDLGLTNARFKDLHLSGTGYFGTSVGIGTTSPVTPLHVSTAKSSVTDSVLTLQDTTETFGRMIEFVGQGSTDSRGIIGFQEPQANAPELFIASGGGDASGTGVGLAFWSYVNVDRIIPCDNLGALQDNVIDLGSSNARFDDIYATNGTIQTSDRNDKQDIEEITDAETRVATACKGLIRKFRWKSAVAEKDDNSDSDETARIHFGIIAQDLQDAFTAEGLDAGDYAMFTSQTWEDSDGVEQTRLGVRYSELLAFIIAAI